MCLAFFQLITTVLLVGFIFALIWSLLIIKRAFENEPAKQTPSQAATTDQSSW